MKKHELLEGAIQVDIGKCSSDRWKYDNNVELAVVVKVFEVITAVSFRKSFWLWETRTKLPDTARRDEEVLAFLKCEKNAV